MEKKMIGGIGIVIGCLVVIDGFARLNSLSAQVWSWFGFIDTAAYAEIGVGALVAIGSLALIFAGARQRP